MRDFPSCFGENGVQLANEASPNNLSKTAPTLVSSGYQCKSRCGSSRFITFCWTKHLMGRGLTILVDNSSQVEIKPWLFSNKKGCRTLESESRKNKIFWDLTNAQFASGAEPVGDFNVAIHLNQELAWLLGDLGREARTKLASDPVDSKRHFCLKKREHFLEEILRGRVAALRRGTEHDISIECDTGGLSEPSLVVRVDRRTVMKIRRLKWKFRGNYTISVDGSPLKVFWDVHNWLFGNAATTNSAVFMFQTSQSNSDPSPLDCSCSPKSNHALERRTLEFPTFHSIIPLISLSM